MQLDSSGVNRLLWFCSLWDGCESFCRGLSGSSWAEGWKGLGQVLLASSGSGWSLGLREEEKNNSLLPCPTSLPASPGCSGATLSRSSAVAASETFTYLWSATGEKTHHLISSSWTELGFCRDPIPPSHTSACLWSLMPLRVA